jgi:tetratricopeptide (TPR) repeat protein
MPPSVARQQVLAASPALVTTAAALPEVCTSPSVIPRELPPAAAHFTGRTQELATLTGLLDTSRRERPGTVVISAIGGTAGVGKTALAVYWAHQVAERFPDGQLYVNLRGYDRAQPVPATDALARFLRSLGVPDQDIPPEPDERAARFRSLLAGKRMLVVLDNASSAEQVRPLLPGTPACAVLVTSRDTLVGLVATDGAWRLDLGLLPLADAAALLGSVIGSRADDDPESAAELAGLCVRLPLALRIAAELAAARRLAPLRELVAELSATRLDCLDAGEDRSDIRAVFSWSCRQLTDDVGRTFALTGLHPGEDIDVHAVAALAGTGPGQARRAMGRLHRASLVQASGPGRYAMHDLLRAYAREQAAARDTDGSSHQALTRLFDYYLAAADAAMDLAFPAEALRRPRITAGAAVVPAMASPGEARAWLGQERANLVAALVHSASHGWSTQAADLAATLYGYLVNGSHLPEADKICRQALQAARQCGDTAAEAGALSCLGSISLATGRFRDAAGHYQAALKLCRDGGDRSGQARALHNLGIAEYDLNNHQSAAAYYREAIAAYESAGDRLGAAGALSNLACVEIDQGSLEQASVLYSQALATYRRIGRPDGVATALANLGEVNLHQGDYRQAISYLRQALTLFRQPRRTGRRDIRAAYPGRNTALDRPGRRRTRRAGDSAQAGG